MSDQHRLVTRSDFDGLVCAVLLKKLGMIDDVTFVHPKDVQDGVVEVTGRDILTNLPYAPAAPILDRTSPLDIGALMLAHGGGGRRNAGTCQVSHDEAERTLDLIDAAVNTAAAAAA